MRSQACHVMMLAVAACAATLGAAAQGEQPGDESTDVPRLEHSGPQTKFDFAPGVPQQGTSVFQPSPALGALQDASDGWVITGGPYLFLAGIEGDATIAGTTAELDLSFSDILDNFDLFGVSGRVEAWKDQRWAIIFDGMYLDLEGNFATPGPLPLVINVDITQVQIDLGLGYRLFDQPLTDDAQGPRVLFDALGGVRYQYFKEELTISPLPTLGDSADWLGRSIREARGRGQELESLDRTGRPAGIEHGSAATRAVPGFGTTHGITVLPYLEVSA